MTKYLLILFVCIIGFSTENHAQRKSAGKPDSKDFAQLFSEFIFETETDKLNQLESLLQDTLRQYSNSSPHFKSEEQPDSITGEINLEFRFDENDWEYSIRKRNVFIIHLTRDNHILVNRDKRFNEVDTVETLAQVSKQISEFIPNIDNKIWLPQKEFRVDPTGDTILSSKHGFFIRSALLEDSLGKSSSWFELRQIVKTILPIYERVRNDYSLENYDGNYNSLGRDNRNKVVIALPIRLIIYLDFEYKPKPPMPIESPIDSLILMELEQSNEIKIGDIINK